MVSLLKIGKLSAGQSSIEWFWGDRGGGSTVCCRPRMSKGCTESSYRMGSHCCIDSNETPSKFLHEIGPGITPVITGHGDVNFFERSFEKAMAENGAGSKLPPLKGVPALNSKLKLNSIQLISPPSDSSTNNIEGLNMVPEYNLGMRKHRQSDDLYPGKGPHLTPDSISEGMNVMSGGALSLSAPLAAANVQQMYRPPMSQHPNMVPVFMEPSRMAMAMAPHSGPVASGGGVGLHPVVSSDALSNQAWAVSIQQAKASTMEKQMRFQEKNRLAAMKSRQRKKQEWERLQSNEKALVEQNRSMKERIAVLEGEIRVLRESHPSGPQRPH